MSMCQAYVVKCFIEVFTTYNPFIGKLTPRSTREKLVHGAIAGLGLQDEFQSLNNDTACGLWVGQRPNDTVVVGAAYDGCYVREEDGMYVMTLLLEEIENGAVEQYKMDKECPVVTAKDAPSADICLAVNPVDRLACASPPVTREACEYMGCCYSTDTRMPCYFGNKLTTVCTADNNMVIAVSKDLTVPSLDLSSVSVVNVDLSTCLGFSRDASSSFAVFSFPLSCGVSYAVPDRPVIYENTIESVRHIQTWQGSSITRDSKMQVTVRCSFEQTAVVPVQLSVSTLPPPPPVTSDGPLQLEMRIAWDGGYTSYYADNEYPVVKVLQDPVYLEVRIIRRTDPELVLILNDCWATSSEDPTLLPQWPILLDSCPFVGDNYLSQPIPVEGPSQVVPIPSHYKRFLVNTFTFVDSNSQLAIGELVYFHCSASVCVPSATDNCLVSCAPRNKRMAEYPEVKYQSMVTSDGPVEFVSLDVGKLKLEGVHSQHSSMVPVRALAIVGVVASVTVAVLGLWLHRRSQACNKSVVIA
ncbi:zona pellucida sperm-binding protein 4-like [Gastrophryne carolinensis]